MKQTCLLLQAGPASPLVSQDQSVSADCPTILLVHEEGEEILLGSAFLLDPGATAVARTQDDAAAAHDPAVAVANKLHAQQGRARWRFNRRPASSAVDGAHDRPALAGCPSFFLVAKIDVIDRGRRSGGLFRPGVTGVFGAQNCTVGADDPAVLLVHKIDVNQLRLRGCVQDLPTCAVSRDRQDAADNRVAAADRAHHPTSLLALEAKAVKL